jgi:pimeloyl-ACP methyl ester carboxylesterase
MIKKFKDFTISYDDVGRGKTIFFIHGFLTSKKVFEPLIAILSKKYRCVSIDVPGFGDSKIKGKISIKKIVFAITKFVKWLGLKKHYLVGNSFGGALSLLYQSRNPKRVIKIVLISPFINFKQLPKILFYFVRFWLPDLIYTRFLLPLFKIILFIINAEYKKEVSKTRGVKKRAVRACKIAIELSQLDLFSLISKIEKEILVVYGSKDSLLNLLPIKPIFRTYTNIHLKIFRNTRHFIYTFDTKKLAKVIDLFFDI